MTNCYHCKNETCSTSVFLSPPFPLSIRSSWFLWPQIRDVREDLTEVEEVLSSSLFMVVGTPNSIEAVHMCHVFNETVGSPFFLTPESVPIVRSRPPLPPKKPSLLQVLRWAFRYSPPPSSSSSSEPRLLSAPTWVNRVICYSVHLNPSALHLQKQNKGQVSQSGVMNSNLFHNWSDTYSHLRRYKQACFTLLLLLFFQPRLI